MGITLTERIFKMTRKIFYTMQQNQEQTCDNFADLNMDMDDIKGHLMNIETKLDELTSLIKDK